MNIKIVLGYIIRTTGLNMVNFNGMLLFLLLFL